ncbi:MAG TPA: nucleotidyltransferase domain-containing protein [Ardenticatenaceae bacterium]|nr:nucleotidyltransferase domain-containing protein [Ardenticatenaceae bacterium]
MSDTPLINPNFIIPIGTQVVTRVALSDPSGTVSQPRGAVGIVVKAPVDNTHSYRVRFPDGVEAPLKRHELSIRKHFQQAGFEQAETLPPGVDLYKFVIYRCVVGSRAYGLNETGSDVDRRGIYLPPADLHWSLTGVPEQLENHETQEAYWELHKFLMLGLKANPNILECLYTPLVETVTPLAQELLDMRQVFLSQLVYQTYNGYVMSQFKKLEQDLRNRGKIRWKHAMHLVRLLLSGITVLREGIVPLHVGEHRAQLLAIRRGQLPWDEVNAWRLSLHKTFDAAFAATALPERPDYERANAFLIAARRSMV